MSSTSSQSAGGFSRTKQAATLLSGLIGCANSQCSQKSTELQYLGTICKHAFCWDCINDFTRANQSTPPCSLCCSPLEVARPVPAIMYNNLSSSLEKFSQLLVEYERAMKQSQPAHSIMVQTQQLFESDFEAPRPLRTIEQFIETQRHMDINDCGLEDSRPNSNASSASNTQNVASDGRSITPDVPAVGDHTSSCSGITEFKIVVEAPVAQHRISQADENMEVEDEFEIGHSPVETITDSVPVLHAPLLTSTQRHSPDLSNQLFLTQMQMEVNSLQSQVPPTVRPPPVQDLSNQFFATQMMAVNSLQSQVVVNSPPPVKPARYKSLFTKRPTFSFGSKRDLKQPAEDPWTKAINAPAVPRRAATIGGGSSSSASNSSASAQNQRTRRSSIKEVVVKEETLIKEEPRTPTRASSTNRNLDLPRRGRRTYDQMLLQAVLVGNRGAVERLIEDGHDVNEYSPSVGTPLYAAVKHGDLEMCRMIVEAGALINACCGVECNTALHLAVEKNNEQIVQYLLSKGASKHVRNIRGKSALELAASSNTLKNLFDKYQNYPRQPSIPPALPDNLVVVLDESVVSLTKREKEHIDEMMTLTKTIDNSTTHYVVELDGTVAKLTLQLVYAMLRGCSVVSLSWLMHCLSEKRVLPDALRYEVKHLQFMENSVATDSLSRCRRNKEKMVPGLFRGCKFFLQHSTFRIIDEFCGGKAKTRTAISEIIRLAEGEIVLKEPAYNETDPKPYHRAIERTPYYVLYDTHQPVPHKIMRNPRLNMVSIDWLFDCITNHRFATPY